MIKAKLLKIYLREGDKFEGELMYKYLIKLMKNEGLSGATVYKGICGYGIRGIAEFDIFRLSMNLPVIIECIDVEENINRVLPKLYEVVKNNGLIAITECEVYKG
ncbi:MAG: DUF190 domain-containing protein [Methanococci archaeon]|uniref:Uncharacterized protein n=1 Tax=Methanocaldococcus vulcanius (strain ATCC 700851 / DSM 12094 / M7) TaxID=579137 RepID=C9REV9_METVM|nr:DUF190 domain-containing protein [Methanocaldococcus vulcanius]ACX72111.1 protein of unknown function DUF190 [Methanocaldococcus vulcanius M7]NPA62903.1 DUF190 domain-containing protein [Methanococci archaeon]